MTVFAPVSARTTLPTCASGDTDAVSPQLPFAGSASTSASPSASAVSVPVPVSTSFRPVSADTLCVSVSSVASPIPGCSRSASRPAASRIVPPFIARLDAVSDAADTVPSSAVTL